MSGTKWSGQVTEQSDALDLDEGVFTWGNPNAIADSLYASAEQSRRKKSSSYQSAMSMLSFYINRAGNNLDRKQANILEEAKQVLREKYRQK